MRLLVVTPYYPPEGGGLERYAEAMSGRMAAHGHDVRVLACTRGDTGEEGREGVLVKRHHARWSIGNAPIDPTLAGRIRDEIRTLGADAVWAHAPVPFPAEMAARAAGQEEVPFVLTYHSGRLRGSTVIRDALATLARVTTERHMIDRADRVIAVSPFVRDNALARHPRPVPVIPPGVDLDRLGPGPVVDPAEILFVAPLDTSYRWKGIDVLWDAYLRVRETLPTARLRLVGTGDRVEEFQERADACDGHVELAGRLGEEELVMAYQRAGVVVLPSTTDAEAFGMVLAEANACGRPVIGSRVGGIPDFVRDGHNGLLAEPGDADDLAKAILRIIQDPALGDDLGRRGRLLVEEHHDWDRLALRTEEVLESAVVESRSRVRPHV